MIIKLKIWVFLFMLNLVDSQNHTCNSCDLQGLKAFMQELESPIPGWWESNSSCCNWVGITCDPHSGRIIKLELQNKRLTGGVSELISSINQLKTLNLSHNFLTGMVPISVFHLTHLQILDLNSNGFSGRFPGSIYLPALEYLDVSANAFRGSIPGGLCVNSTRVQVVKLAGNSLTGSFPPELRNCEFLEHICIAKNNISGPIPGFLFHLPRLTNLDLQYNKFDSIPGIGIGDSVSPITRLDISGNQFSGHLPDIFHKFPNLTRFVADTNHFTGPIPFSLANSPSISVINLRNNSFNGPIKFNCSVMTNLTSIDIGTNNFSGFVPDDLYLCRKLRAINFARNKLQGEIPESFSKLKSLMYVSFSNCSLNNVNSALRILQHCPNLTVLVLTLNFHNEHLPDIGPFHFNALKALVIPDCGLTGVIPSWIRGLTRLQLLDLSWNSLTGEIPAYLGDFTSLFYLDLSNNSLTGEIPKSLTRLPSLRTLNVTLEEDSPDFPFFTKPNVSAQVSPLQYKRVMSFPPCIDLKFNLLNGPIWPEFGKLKRLHVLNLGNNRLSGGIPSELSGMTSIETLVLSHNNLSGPIPPSLVNLSFLSSFDVSFNRLSGIVPSGGQFGTFTNEKFEGNKDLCVSVCVDKDKDKDNETRVYRSTTTGSKKSNGPVIGMAIGIGLGTLFLLALMFVIILRVTSKQEIGPENEDGYTSNKDEPESKLVFFQTKDELSIDDLLKSTNSFDQANIIGCGGFGLVFKATLPNGQKVAIKRLTGDAGQVDREFQAEVETLSRAQHPNLVLLQGYCQHQNDRFLIYSYMENGSLDYWLHEKPDGPIKLNWATRLRIGQGAVKGLAYLHQSCDPHIVHRDIKSSNILLDENFEAHLADFGLARLLLPHDTHVTTDLVGTLGYIPPEYGQASVASYKGDVYSFGVVLLELLTGKRPMDMCKPKGCRDLISWVMEMRRENREDEVFDPVVLDKDNEKEMLQVLEIACVCLSESPKLRPSSQELLGWLHRGNLHT